MAGEKAVEKTLASRAWKSLRDSHFPTATTTTSVLWLHIKWLDGERQGYIFDGLTGGKAGLRGGIFELARKVKNC